MRLLIIDPHPAGGHHALYVTAVAQEAKRQNWDVRLVATKTAIENASFAITRGAIEPSEMIHAPEPLRGRHQSFFRIGKTLQCWNTLRQSAMKAKADFQADAIFVPDCDMCLPATVLLGSPFRQTPWVSVLLTSPVADDSVGLDIRRLGIKEQRQMATLLMALQRCSHLTVLSTDRRLADSLPVLCDRGFSRIVAIPEIAQIGEMLEKREARRRLGLADGGHLICLYGAIGMRKGLREFCQVVEAIEPWMNVRGLIAGQADDVASRFLASTEVGNLVRTGRLVVRNQHLTPAEIGLVLSASDLCWAAYPRFRGASGVLWESCLAGVPVVAGNRGIMAHWVRHYGMGVLVDAEHPIGIAEGLVQFLRDESALHQVRANLAPAAQQFKPGVISFGEAIMSSINERLMSGTGHE